VKRIMNNFDLSHVIFRSIKNKVIAFVKWLYFCSIW